MRVAVVGFGVMGKYHANVYAALPHVDLVAVVEPMEARRMEAKASYAVATYADVASLVQHERVDAVSVAAPTSMHFGITKELLESGVNVLVEKPVATNVAQAQYLADLSRRLDLVLQVGHITRFYRAVQILNNRVKSPYLIEARRLTPTARIKDVGVILDLMIHDIDIVLGLVPSAIAEFTVNGHVLNGSPFEDVAAAQIVFENGCIARFLASRVAPDAERTLVVAERHQTLRVDFGKEPHIELAAYRSLHDHAAGTHVQMDRTVVQEDNPLRKELEHFLARIRRRASPIGTLSDDIRSLEVATKLITSLVPARARDSAAVAV